MSWRDDMDIERVIEGRAFIDGELRYAEIGICDGKIVTVGRLVSGGDERVDVGSSRIILPGFMDPHVHFRDPGMTNKETFDTGTMAAVHGGVTCVLDMPNTKPPVTDVQTLLDKKASVRGRANVDYGLFAAVTANVNAGMIAPLVPAFKLFMGSTTGNILLDDDEEMIPAVRDVLVHPGPSQEPSCRGRVDCHTQAGLQLRGIQDQHMPSDDAGRSRHGEGGRIHD